MQTTAFLFCHHNSGNPGAGGRAVDALIEHLLHQAVFVFTTDGLLQPEGDTVGGRGAMFWLSCCSRLILSGHQTQFIPKLHYLNHSLIFDWSPSSPLQPPSHWHVLLQQYSFFQFSSFASTHAALVNFILVIFVSEVSCPLTSSGHVPLKYIETVLNTTVISKLEAIKPTIPIMLTSIFKLYSRDLFTEFLQILKT